LVNWTELKGINLFNGDCMEYMKTMPDNFAALAIVDPPYGILADSFSNGQNLNRSDGWKRGESTSVRLNKKRAGKGNGGGKLKDRILNTSKCFWDANAPSVEYFKELERVSIDRIIWGGNYFDLPPTRGIIAWDKCQPWENFSQFELAWTSFDRPARLIRLSNTGGDNKEKKIHPTQKRVDLYEWLLKNYAKEGDKILDTHFGSLSIGIACHNMKQDLIAFEIDNGYFEAGKARLEQHQKQEVLF